MFKHLHIVSCAPRSGTTLLHEVMATCLKVDKHYDHEIRFHKAWAASGQVLLTKRPKDTLYVPELLATDPEFYVVYLLRDPRDVIVSRHAKDDSRYYVNIRVWRELDAIARRVDSHERFLTLKYEDFVSEPDRVQDAICQRFSWLESRHDFSQYHRHAVVSAKSERAMHGVRPIAPTSVGRWRQNLPRIKGQHEIHGSLTPDLVTRGYESSGDWERCLESVIADSAPSVYAERLHPIRRFTRKLDARRKLLSYRKKRVALARSSRR